MVSFADYGPRGPWFETWPGSGLEQVTFTPCLVLVSWLHAKYMVIFIFRKQVRNPILECNFDHGEFRTRQSALSRSFLGVKSLPVNRFSKFLWHFLRLLEYKSMIRSHFAGGVSEQDDMQKGSFQRMVYKGE